MRAKTMARRRHARNRSLEDYVYIRPNGYVFYKHPRMSKPVSFKKDIETANTVARQCNAQYAVKELSITAIMGGSITFNDVLDRFVRDRIPELKWSKSYTDENLRKLTKFRGQGDTDYESTDVRFFSDLVDTEFEGDGRRRAILLLRLIDRYAVGKGMRKGPNVCDGILLPERKKRERRRIADYEEFKNIQEFAEPWLRRAMDFSLITLQPREVICGLALPRASDNVLRVTRGKTGANIAIHIGDSLQRVIQECRVEAMRLGSRKLICKRQRGGKVDIAPPYLTRAFTKAVKDSGQYPDRHPTFHEIRSLGSRMYKETGYSTEFVQVLMGHTEQKTTEIYLENGPKFTEAQALMELK